MIEAMLQRQVLAHLSTFAPRAFFWRSNTGGAKTAQGFIHFGIAGQSDILGVAAGRFVAIELKTDVGRQNKAQQAFERAITKANGLYILARTVDEAVTPVRELLV